MVTLKGSHCADVPLETVAGVNRRVQLDHPLLATVRGLGVSLGEPVAAN
jgi:hypothetical protein